jgi:hypothetical protein
MSSGEIRKTGYRPEVRTSYGSPTLVNGTIVDSAWRTIKFDLRNDTLGIPIGYFDANMKEHGLLGYAQAEAIRWWFIAQADAEQMAGSLYLETRLQAYDLVLTHKITPKDAIGAIDSRGRPMPQQIKEETK